MRLGARHCSSTSCHSCSTSDTLATCCSALTSSLPSVAAALGASRTSATASTASLLARPSTSCLVSLAMCSSTCPRRQYTTPATTSGYSVTQLWCSTTSCSASHLLLLLPPPRHLSRRRRSSGAPAVPRAARRPRSHTTCSCIQGRPVVLHQAAGLRGQARQAVGGRILQVGEGGGGARRLGQDEAEGDHGLLQGGLLGQARPHLCTVGL